MITKLACFGLLLALMASDVIFAALPSPHQVPTRAQRATAKPPVSALLSLTAYLQHVRTMTAEFTQEVRDETGVLLQQSHGHMAWQRPDRFKWSVIAPNQQLMVADGRWLWVYTPSLSQVTKQPLSHRVGTPVSLLSGSVLTIGHQFSVTMRRQQHLVVYELQPKDSQAPFSSIALSVKDGKLLSMRFEDQLHQSTTFSFSNIATNQPLPKALFEFLPPPSVSVVDQT